MPYSDSNGSELRLKYERSLGNKRYRNLKINRLATPSLRDKYQLHKATQKKFTPRIIDPVTANRDFYDSRERIDENEYINPIKRGQEVYRQRPLSSTFTPSSHTRLPRSFISKPSKNSKVPRYTKLYTSSKEDYSALNAKSKESSMFSKLRGYLGELNPFKAASDSELRGLENSAKRLYNMEMTPKKKVTFQAHASLYNLSQGIDVDPVDEILQQAKHSDIQPPDVRQEVGGASEMEVQSLKDRIALLLQDMEVLREEKIRAASSIRSLEMRERELKDEIQLTKDQYESRIFTLEQLLEERNREKTTLRAQLEQKDSALSQRDLQLQDLQKTLESDVIELTLSQKIFDQKGEYMSRQEKIMSKKVKLEQEIQRLCLTYNGLIKDVPSASLIELNSTLKTYERIKESLLMSNLAANSADASTTKDLVERMMVYTESEILKKNRRLQRLTSGIKVLPELSSSAYLRKVRQMYAILSKTRTLLEIQSILSKLKYKSQVRIEIKNSGLPYTLQEKWLTFSINEEGIVSDDEEDV